MEADIDTLRGLHALGDFERLLRLVNVDAHRLFAVDVLAGCHGRFKMLDVEEWRRGDLNHIDVWRSGKLLKGVRAVKQKLAVDGLAAKARVDLVKVVTAGCELIGKQVGKRHHLRRRVLRERRGHVSAAVSAAEQAMPHGGVGLVAEGRAAA